MEVTNPVSLVTASYDVAGSQRAVIPPFLSSTASYNMAGNIHDKVRQTTQTLSLTQCYSV